MKDVIELRHKIHAHPEVSGEEQETADRITSFLEQTHPDTLTTEVGGTGILARYKGNKDKPTVLLRCELDALPIGEENDIEYQSVNEGKGHKCGHDGHMAILCGVARALEDRDAAYGDILLLFQPAEETGEGAARVLEDKKFKQMNPDYVFALHNLPGFKMHSVIVRHGVFAAASVGFIARFKGATSHAAHPEEGNSPALAMAQLVQSLSSFPQYYTSMEQAAKVTVIEAKLGEIAFGTSPDKAEVMATLRTYDEDMLGKLKQKAKTIAEGIAKTYELELQTEWSDPFPVTQNHDNSVNIVIDAAKELDANIINKEEPFGWSEDFGHFTHTFEGAMFGLGSGSDQPQLHASDYDFPDEIIETGVDMFLKIVDVVNNKG